MSLRDGDKRNFATLQKVFANGDACIIEGQSKDTGNQVAVVCAKARGEDGEEFLQPFARMFEGDPLDEVILPDSLELIELQSKL